MARAAREAQPERIADELRRSVFRGDAILSKESEDDFAKAGARRHQTKEKGHGREETRAYLHMPVPPILPGLELWKGIKFLLEVVAGATL